MELAGKGDWMLSKGIEDETKARGGVKEEDQTIKCSILYPSIPPLSPYYFQPFTQSPAHSLSLSAQIPEHF